MAHLKTFTKYHGNGNDFIIFDSFTSSNDLSIPWLIKNAPKLCDRHQGIGADGIMVLLKDDKKFQLVVINRDGSVAKNCGNGLRCAASYLFKKLNIKTITIELAEKEYFCLKQDNQILVDMGNCSIEQIDQIHLPSFSEPVIKAKILIGNSHEVYFFNKPIICLDTIINEIKVQSSENVNIGLLFKEEESLFSKVYEQGVGFTNACGSGACAAASFFAELFLTTSPNRIVVRQPGGMLTIDLEKEILGNQKALYRVHQCGPAQELFTGFF